MKKRHNIPKASEMQPVDTAVQNQIEPELRDLRVHNFTCNLQITFRSRNIDPSITKETPRSWRRRGIIKSKESANQDRESHGEKPSLLVGAMLPEKRLNGKASGENLRRRRRRSYGGGQLRTLVLRVGGVGVKNHVVAREREKWMGEGFEEILNERKGQWRVVGEEARKEGDVALGLRLPRRG